MLHFKSFLKFFIFVSLFSLSVRANEQKPAAAEAPVESGNYSGQQDESWVQLQTELTSAKTKMDAQQTIVTELLVSKKNNKGRLSKDQVDQLSLNHQKLQDLIKKYNEKFQAFENMHPEKGQTFGRQYSRKKEQTLNEMESSLTLDGRIRKINKKIKAQFGVEDNAEKNTNSADKPPAPFKPKNDVTEKIIIVK